MYEILDAPELKTYGKCYNAGGIYMGCFLGSPLLAGYFMAHNYNILGRRDLIARTWLFAVVATVVLLAIPWLLPADFRVPNLIITLVISIIVRTFADYTQGEMLNKFLAQGGQYYSKWRAFGIGLAVTIAFLGILAVLNTYNTEPPPFEF